MGTLLPHDSFALSTGCLSSEHLGSRYGVYLSEERYRPVTGLPNFLPGCEYPQDTSPHTQLFLPPQHFFSLAEAKSASGIEMARPRQIGLAI